MTEILQKDCILYALYIRLFELHLFIFTEKISPRHFWRWAGYCTHNKKRPFCARPNDQKLGSSLIYFFCVHTTIQPNYMVLFYLFFLLCTTIRLRLRVLTDLFLLFAHDHLTKIYGPISFIVSFVHDHSTKN